MLCTPQIVRSIANGLEPAVGQFSLQRIVFEGVTLPKILLPNPDDVILLTLRVVPVPRLVLGNEVFISAGGDRAAHASNVHLGARVEQIWQIPYANAVAYVEAGGHVPSISALHSGPSPLQPFRATRSARRGSCRPAFGRRTKPSVRSKGSRSRAIDPNRCLPRRRLSSAFHTPRQASTSQVT